MEKTFPKVYSIKTSIDIHEYKRIQKFMKDTHRDNMSEMLRIALRSYMGKWVEKDKKINKFDKLHEKVKQLEQAVKSTGGHISSDMPQ